MRLGIVPIQLLITLCNQITVSLNYLAGKIQIFPDVQRNTVVEPYITGDFRESRTMLNQDERGMTNDRVAVRQAVDKLLVFGEGWQHIKLFEVQDWGLGVKRRLAFSTVAQR